MSSELRVPRSSFCLGTGEKIQIHFDLDDRLLCLLWWLENWLTEQTENNSQTKRRKKKNEKYKKENLLHLKHGNPGGHQHRRGRLQYIRVMDYNTISKLCEHLHVVTWKTLSDELKQQVIEETMWSYILLAFKASQGWDLSGAPVVKTLCPHCRGWDQSLIK